ncbi:hypothetical protein [Flavobacterium cellulosilyticum]|uniref:hypothetical protein n=1 Tax=Flavobacterium cellulosilyticum TaxID=2541731 RepID=UPI001404BFD9|nr:hypothetical protein [Flavobacterium cellulosilyticum]
MSDAFENPTFVTVTVLGTGSGNYEYQLDDSLFQDSTIFSNIAAGEHFISVRDKDGHCNPAPLMQLLSITLHFSPQMEMVIMTPGILPIY